MARAAKKSGRQPGDVTLIAVSKLQPVSAIREAVAAGQRDFGESYAQELDEKARALADLPIRWHFIGHLQRNKVKLAAPHVSMVQSVDSVRLAQELSAAAQQRNTAIDVLLQVNVGDEAQKSGCSAQEAPFVAEELSRLPGLHLKGLMCIPPFDLDEDDTRRHFIALRALRDRLGGPPLLPHLSMGMSGDFEMAIEEGATMVRVGTSIFGERRRP